MSKTNVEESATPKSLRYETANGSPFDFGVSRFHLIIADVDRDATMDVVATSGDSVRVLLGDGRGAFKQSRFDTGWTRRMANSRG
jgi:hypothetical protein